MKCSQARHWFWSLCAVALLGILTPVAINGDAALPSTANFPSKQKLLAFLAATIDWHRQFSLEQQQMVTDPEDLLFLEDNRPISVQVVKLSFDFARADLAYVTASAPLAASKGAQNTAAAGPVFQHLIEVEAKSEAAAQQANSGIEQLQQQRTKARGASRDKLDAEIADAQSQMRLLQSISASFRSLRDFIRATDGGQTDASDLATFVDGLEQTVPAIASAPAGPPAVPPAKGPDVAAGSGRGASGILGKIARVSAIALKRRTVEDAISRTDQLAETSQGLLSPLAAELNLALQNPDLLTAPQQSSDLGALQDQEARLNALMSETAKVSPAITALAKQKILLALYRTHLSEWRVSIRNQYRTAWKDLVVRVTGLCGVIALLIGIGAVSRGIVTRHVHDTNSRHMILIGQRIVLCLAIVLIVSIAFAFDLRSLATFLGIASAGLAVAMQNVILAVIGYFLLVGKLRVRVGDRVQISGVSGEVVEIGLMQFRLRELDSPGDQPTGRVVSFSNSFLFLTPATGLFKRNGQREAAGAGQ